MDRRVLGLWGKWGGHQDAAYHPLLWHMADVGLAAQALWDEVFSDAQRGRLAQGFGLSLEEARAWLPFLVALHDLGKASPQFQGQVQHPACLRMLEGIGIAPLTVVQVKQLANRKHGQVTAAELPPLLVAKGMHGEAAQAVAISVGGHHGVFPGRSRSKDDNLGGHWPNLRQALFDALAEAFGLAELTWPGASVLDAAPLVLLAGWTTVADWIGSNQDYFGPGADAEAGLPTTAWDSYLARSRQQVTTALAELGWNLHPARAEALDFEALFGFAPNPMQRAALEVGAQWQGPGLVVIEAAMGQGKTEAALALMDTLQTQGHRGAYFALPTQATSNQLFSRTADYLRRRYPGEVAQLLLQHGHADFQDEFAWLKKQGLAQLPGRAWGVEEDGASEEAKLVAMSWFSHKKRGLLAPYGVGTIDQSLLAALRVKHLFVRLFGLAGKVVIFDEVHAYDVYMSTLLERLLAWLGALGSPVILLSATLPQARRAALVAAYQGASAGGGSELTVPYPRLTWAQPQGETRCIPLEAPATKPVTLEWVLPRPGDEEQPWLAWGAWLQAKLFEEGGCALVLCNTVRTAQACARHFASLWPEEELQVFHARFPFSSRKAREDAALAAFGKKGSRPRRAVLVATQVVEQSLDLDFDLILSEVAPVDLVLQRVGRLHRHERARPAGLAQATLALAAPVLDEHGVPSFGQGSEKVYGPLLLWRSWEVLRARDGLAVPEDLDSLVAAVYDDVATPCGSLSPQQLEAWQAFLAEWRREGQVTEGIARDRVVALPKEGAEEDPPSLTELTHLGLFDEDAKVHRAWRAETRLTQPTVTVVCAWAQADGTWRFPSGVSLDLQAKLGLEEVRAVMEAAVSLSNPGVVFGLRALTEPVLRPAAWQRHAWLQDFVLLPLDEQGHFSGLAGWRLHLDPLVGLVTEKEAA